MRGARQQKTKTTQTKLRFGEVRAPMVNQSSRSVSQSHIPAPPQMQPPVVPNFSSSAQKHCEFCYNAEKNVFFVNIDLCVGRKLHLRGTQVNH